jgi:hypothetical protein
LRFSKSAWAPAISVKSEIAADNKRHTNAHPTAHLPLTNWEYNPSSSATAQNINKDAMFDALLQSFRFAE